MPKVLIRPCARCQAVVPSETQFCPSCGLSLVQADREALELR
jgi:RNA polymerase subunit RPABC4/transcription elongation factor Spt4